jgi:hypothetical protein
MRTWLAYWWSQIAAAWCDLMHEREPGTLADGDCVRAIEVCHKCKRIWEE